MDNSPHANNISNDKPSLQKFGHKLNLKLNRQKDCHYPMGIVDVPTKAT